MSRSERARLALDALRRVIPSPQTELEYVDEYQLVVAVILSAQCTDERINRVTPALFEAYPTIMDLARAEPVDVFPFIRSVSYPNNKSKHLVGMARRVVDDFGGRLPKTLEDLTKLPGVGRKTAQVVLSVAFAVHALPVDTHVFRVANRIGITRGAETPLKVETQLKRILPKEEWGEAHHLLILHGRYTCTARNPACDACPVAPVCLYHQRLRQLPEPLEGLDRRAGRYYCRTSRQYFNEPVLRTDRYGTDQTACPSCGSMNLYNSRTGKTTKKAPDFRIA